MFDVATRKRVFWKLVAMLDTLPFRSSTIGMMVFFFHNLGIGFPVIMTLLGPLNTWFYASYVLLALLLPLHAYFQGCVCIRLERHFLGIKDWKGMWVVPFGMLEDMGLPLTKKTQSSIYVVTGATIMLLGLLRIAWSQIG